MIKGKSRILKWLCTLCVVTSVITVLLSLFIDVRVITLMSNHVRDIELYIGDSSKSTELLALFEQTQMAIAAFSGMVRMCQALCTALVVFTLTFFANSAKYIRGDWSGYKTTTKTLLLLMIIPFTTTALAYALVFAR